MSVQEAVQPERVIYDANQILKILPHRYPFILIDKVVEFEDDKRVVAIKAVSGNEPFFQGHFPGRPVMPGVLILEAMAQTGAILAHKSADGVAAGKTVFIVGATDVKWKKMVVPGDLVRIELVSVKKRRPLWLMSAVATVAGKVVASAQLSAMEAD